jgi:methionine salvage enolase-phosphatase E1
MKYRLYIDEVGNPDLESSENPNHRFLSITGVIFELNYVKEVVFPELESLKQEFFKSHPDEPIILHRKEIVNAKHPFEALKNDKIRNKFDETLLSLF